MVILSEGTSVNSAAPRSKAQKLFISLDGFNVPVEMNSKAPSEKGKTQSIDLGNAEITFHLNKHITAHGFEHFKSQRHPFSDYSKD